MMLNTSSKCFKCPSQLLLCIFPSLVVYQDVIKEDQKILPQLISENMVHARLEGCWCVGQPKGHDQKLEMPKVEPESCLLNILLPDANLTMVA
jgi:hypothetical protein